ncbi:MAG: GIY-YIG nuclease family protein [Deltaproteobacteria bacterium]|nr:GIY-YIG nuclease family protein [Deltaproteobacteria bacterium]
MVSVLEASPEHPLSASEAPRQPGIYVLFRRGVPVYVGQARQLRSRLNDHLKKIKNRRSTLLDPTLTPEKREAGELVSSRAILNACRTYAWKDKFPPVSALSPELKKKIEEKWKSVLG